MGFSVANSFSNSCYLSAAVGADGSERAQEIGRDNLLTAVSDPDANASFIVAGTERTVAECLAALVNSGDPEDCEFVMNCAAGTGDIANCAKSLLAGKFTEGADQGVISLIRTMAQSLIARMEGVFGMQVKAQPELLLLAGTVLAGENDDAAIPPATKEAVQAFDQSEWRPVWWIRQPPSAEGSFSLSTVGQLAQGFEGVPAHAKLVNVRGDGSCMFRSCLAIHRGEERWVDAGVSKDEIYKELVDIGWDQKIKTAINLAYEELCEFMPPSPEVQHAFDVDALFARTIGSREFTLYSPHGIGTIMDGVTPSDEAGDAIFFETLADIIAQRFIEASGVSPAPSGCGEPEKFGGKSAWLVHNDVHYDLLVTKDFFKEPAFDSGALKDFA